MTNTPMKQQRDGSCETHQSFGPYSRLPTSWFDKVPNNTRYGRTLRRIAPWRAVLKSCVLILIAFLCGCHSAPKTTYSAELPSQHSVNSKHFVIHSNVRLDTDNVLVDELERLRERVFTTLRLPEQRDPVNVYLFSDEASYRYYMNTTWQNLPPRRAYFVGTSRELAVYSFISPQVQEDLRHEFTHGLLHASLKTVPLWLDEGLAEYFEVDPQIPGAVHADHVREWRTAMAESWSPNLFRLEMLTDFRDMTQRDYAESWGWVHFMLQNSDESADVLLNYLASLESAKTPQRLLASLESARPTYFNDVQAHIVSMQNGQTVAEKQ
ncbi:MAG TPA: DUF1570 domain-containing protein [Planctomycetaceae bacterium]|nr:DUF1570 domain-containing protein [Planctomycetaceae bacterium]